MSGPNLDKIHNMIYEGIVRYNLVPDKVVVGFSLYRDISKEIFSDISYTMSTINSGFTRLVYWYDSETSIPIETEGRLADDQIRLVYHGFNGIQRAIQTLKERRDE